MADDSSCREVLGSVPQRAQPPPNVASGSAGDSLGTAGEELEEGGDDVKSVCPLCPGLHTCYNARYRGAPTRKGEPIPESRAQFGLQAATRLHEGGIASKRRSAGCAEYVPGPCTHRPSHHESQLYQKSLRQPQGGRCPRYGW